MSSTQMVLVAGPYRSGTGDDPAKIEANLKRLEAAAWEVWNRGHIPVIGEWLALPLAKLAGSRKMGDGPWQSVCYPVADRLIPFCQAVLRLEGESKGADGDVELAKRLGIRVLTSVEDLEEVHPQPGRMS